MKNANQNTQSSNRSIQTTQTSNRVRIGLRLMMVATFLCGLAIAELPAQTFTTLHSFDYTDGGNSYAGLIQAPNGNFYGTTSAGGANAGHGNADGTTFEITPGGTLTTLDSFGGSNGANPWGGLVRGANGDFYGTTSVGGARNYGTVFQITPGGTLTTLHSFDNADGAYPYAGLVKATNGNLYGTTYAGGAHGTGTIFEITASGVLTTLYSFCDKTNCTDGAYPYARLIQAKGGNFYGTTYAGGVHGEGTVFEITTTGALTILHSFDGTNNNPDGAYPYAGLVQATNGNFYGTTSGGGAHLNGTVFKITGSGALTILHSFDGADGSSPYAGLIQATNGNFYGTTYKGGANLADGAIFEITVSGTLSTLHSFDGTDGANPYAGLVQGTNGNLYGTTHIGGAYDYGTVFSLSVAK